MATRAFSEFRPVTVSFAGGAMGIDAYKAAINQVQNIEYQYALDNASVVDLEDAVTVFTGTQRGKLYSFTLTLTIATGVYAFTYVETVPNAEELA